MLIFYFIGNRLPVHQEYTSFSERLSTFTNWSSSCPKTPIQLVENGFFYSSRKDLVFCHFCDGGLSDFYPDDDIFQLHKYHFGRECEYVKNYEAGNRIEMIKRSKVY
jgi:baculoviral IAP repeat-containing protein 7/8